MGNSCEYRVFPLLPNFRAAHLGVAASPRIEPRWPQEGVTHPHLPMRVGVTCDPACVLSSLSIKCDDVFSHMRVEFVIQRGGPRSALGWGYFQIQEYLHICKDMSRALAQACTRNSLTF